ncbi:hypothetical protein GCM10022223_49370 [Kineosporia mesophila]|uniref:Uncharacterized protein n=1 Tax=Kineosporia mesophila TaxID=566012 RepID=A0ABP7A749_9ACTN|nr:hypothetical protein [Kineosporia mesophila]MCD5351625.1 hypothetical protein [Kineosporia mesophila]
MSIIDKLDQLTPRAIAEIRKLTPRAIAEARLEAQAERRAAQAAAAEAAHEEATRLAHQVEVAETVNRPFLQATVRWAEPESLAARPKSVRGPLTEITRAAQALRQGNDSVAIISGERSWVEALPSLVEKLLEVAETARGKDPHLSLEITEVLLAARPASRASWRQRALAGEHAGDLPTAMHAHQAYLNLTSGDRLGVKNKLRALEERDDRRLRLVTVLDAALRAGTGLREPMQLVLGLLNRPTPRKELDAAVAVLLDQVLALPLAELARPTEQDVLHHLSRWQRYATLDPAPLAENVARNLRVLRLNDLRQRLAGNRVCLVTDDAQRLKGSGQGARVDDYDVVVRFGPTRNSPADGGTRTDVQVIRHDAKMGWNTQTRLRLILSDDPDDADDLDEAGSPGDWLAAVRSQLVPGRQPAIVEKALRRPLRNPVRDDTEPVAGTAEQPLQTDAYQVLRLLDLLAVCEVVDLVGFHPEHDFTHAEMAWLRPRLEQLDDHAIGVR